MLYAVFGLTGFNKWSPSHWLCMCMPGRYWGKGFFWLLYNRY